MASQSLSQSLSPPQRPAVISPSNAVSASKTMSIRINSPISSQSAVPLKHIGHISSPTHSTHSTPSISLPSIPSISLPLINNIQQSQSLPTPNIQYTLHPTMPTMPTMPMFVVPPNLINNASSSTSTATSTSSLPLPSLPPLINNAAVANTISNKAGIEKLQKILDKQRKKEALSEEERIYLQTEIANTQQQFIQMHAVNANQQIAMLQQQQIWLQQQQILLAQQQRQQQQQQSAYNHNHSPWITTNHYAMDHNAQNNMNGHIVPNYHHSNMNMLNNKYHHNTDNRYIYFGLPEKKETNEMWNEMMTSRHGNKLIFLNVPKKDNVQSDICCEMILDGLGIVQFEKPKTQSVINENEEEKEEKKSDNVRENLNDNGDMKWLANDLRRASLRIRNENEHCSMGYGTKRISLRAENRFNSNIRQIIGYSGSILDGLQLDEHGKNDSYFQISNVNMAHSQIEWINDAEQQSDEYIKRLRQKYGDYNDKKSVEEEKEFVRLCAFMEKNFDPTGGGEMIKNAHLNYAMCANAPYTLRAQEKKMGPIPTLKVNHQDGNFCANTVRYPTNYIKDNGNNRLRYSKTDHRKSNKYNQKQKRQSYNFGQKKEKYNEHMMDQNNKSQERKQKWVSVQSQSSVPKAQSYAVHTIPTAQNANTNVNGNTITTQYVPVPTFYNPIPIPAVPQIISPKGTVARNVPIIIPAPITAYKEIPKSNGFQPSQTINPPNVSNGDQNTEQNASLTASRISQICPMQMPTQQDVRTFQKSDSKIIQKKSTEDQVERKSRNSAEFPPL